MIVFDIETIPNETAIKSRQWAEYKAKKQVEDDHAALLPAFGKVVSICAWDGSTGNKFKQASTNEDQLIFAFYGFLDQCGSEVMAGQNIKKFDIPFLAFRGCTHGFAPHDNINFIGKKPWEITCVDTMEILQFGAGPYTSLDAACLAFGIPSPKEGEVSACSVLDAYKRNDFDSIMEYNWKDVVATAALIKKLKALGIIK